MDWERIKQRKLFQWGLAYLAGAWLVLQALGLLAQPFAWPDLVVRAATVVLGIGFFAALVLAWYHGEKGAQRATAPELLMLTALLVIAAAAVAFVRRDRATIPANAAEGNARPESTAQEGSVAVLPFVNLSEDKANEYFTDGITETLLDELSKVPGLHVPGRTSSFAFKGKNDDLREIGRALGVAHVVEGSVQKANNRIRISAKLTKVADGFQAWSAIYNRDLEDVFAIQDEISRAIFDSLRGRFGAVGRVARTDQTAAGTTDLAAYDLFLKGREFLRKRTGEALYTAIDYFNQAIERDSTYALAYSGLADAYNVLKSYTDRSPAEDYDRAHQAALKAVRYAPELAEAHTSLAYNLLLRWELRKAGLEFERAIALNPNYVTARHWYAEYLSAMRRTKEPVQQGQRAQALDPLSNIANSDAALAYYYDRRYEEALTELQRGLQMDPNYFATHFARGRVYRQLGRLDDAEAAFRKALALAGGSHSGVQARLAEVQAAKGDPVPARQLLAQTKAGGAHANSRAILNLALGDAERAVTAIEQTVLDKSLPPWLLSADPIFDPIRSHPRYQALMKRLGVP